MVNDQSLQRFHIKVTRTEVRCVSLQLRSFGSGFSFIIFSWKHEDGPLVEFMRIYPRDIPQGEWKIMKIKYYSLIGSKMVTLIRYDLAYSHCLYYSYYVIP